MNSSSGAHMAEQIQISLLDGGIGRELERRGAPFRQPEWSALSLMQAPETVKEVHRAYIEAGADIITTNSYALVPFHIGEKRFSSQGRQLAALAGKIARETIEEAKTHHKRKERGSLRVAGSIPPLFGSYRPDLFQAERVNEIVTPLLAGLAEHVDIWLLETQSLIAEPASILPRLPRIKASGGQKRPCWVSFTLQDFNPGPSAQIRSGETVESAVKAMTAYDIQAILFNCSQPETLEEALKQAHETLATLKREDIQLGAYANAFPPQLPRTLANDKLDEIRKDMHPTAYLDFARRWKECGASIIGGCCGIGPEHIRELALKLCH